VLSDDLLLCFLGQGHSCLLVVVSGAPAWLRGSTRRAGAWSRS